MNREKFKDIHSCLHVRNAQVGKNFQQETTHQSSNLILQYAKYCGLDECPKVQALVPPLTLSSYATSLFL